MTTRIDCSEAGFSEFLLANPQLDGHADLIWQLHAVYWRNKRLGHPKAVGLSSPESGDGLPQLVDFLLLPGYLRLDAGRLLGGEVFERQTFGDVATMFMIQGRTPRHETGRRADLRQGRCTCRYRKRRLWPLTRTGTNGMTPDTTCVRSGIRRGSV